MYINFINEAARAADCIHAHYYMKICIEEKEREREREREEGREGEIECDITLEY